MKINEEIVIALIKLIEAMQEDGKTYPSHIALQIMRAKKLLENYSAKTVEADQWQNVADFTAKRAFIKAAVKIHEEAQRIRNA